MIVEASDEWVRLIGRHPTPASPVALASLFDESADTNLERELLQALCEGRAHAVELLCLGAAGRRYWNDIVAIPTDGQERLLVFRDITSRRSAEEALGHIPAADRLLLDRLQSGIVVHRANTEILYANAKATELLGVTAQSVVGAVNTDPRWAFIDADGATVPIEDYPVGRAVRTRAIARNILLGIRRVSDQRLTWILCDAYPVMDATGAVAEVVVSFSDVTQLKEAEQSRQKSEERLQLIIAGSTDAPWDNDIEHGEAYYSPQWYQMLGYAPGSLEEGADLWSRVIHPDDREEVIRKLQSYLADPTVATYEMEFRFVHRDGHAIRTLSRAIIVRDAEGKARRVAGTNSDVTERRALEERLRQSQKLEAIGQLAGGIAHDFNNLLAVISGNLELLRLTRGDLGEAADLVQDALRAADRGAKLTRRLLAFSRQESLQPTAVDIADALRGVAAILKRVITETITVTVSLPDALPLALADAGLLENALLNLAINARDAMPEGGQLTLTAGTESVTGAESQNETTADLKPGQYVRISITDTGRGMSPEVLAHAMEPFFTTKPVGQGTGLGLAMVYGFVRQSGGAMRIRSEVGQGTSVVLMLPVAPAADAHPEPIPEPKQPQESTRHEVVLVVEDDASVRATCRKALGLMGFTVHEASDGPTALRVMDALTRLDLVITDVIMPGGMTGPDLASAIRSRRPTLPVLFMSGYHADILNTESAREDFHLLSKPFSLSELRRAVLRLLPRRDA